MGRPQIARESRILALDVARCFALLLIVAVHLAGPYDAEGEVRAWYWCGNGLAPALFVLASGISLSVAASKRSARSTPVAEGLLAKGLFLMLVGVALAGLGSGIAIILPTFGVLFVLAIGLLKLPTKVLVYGALATVFTALPVLFFAKGFLPPPSYSSPIFSDFSSPLLLLSHVFFIGYYPVVAWLPCFIAGLVMGRLDLKKIFLRNSLMVGSFLVASCSYFLSFLATLFPEVQDRLLMSSEFSEWQTFVHAYGPGLGGAAPSTEPAWLFLTYAHSSLPLWALTATAAAVATFCLCLHVTELRSQIAQKTMAIVSGAGAMTLTLYSLHVLLASPLFMGKSSELIPVHFALLLLIGAVFSALGKRGPLEHFSGLLLRAKPAHVVEKS